MGKNILMAILMVLCFSSFSTAQVDLEKDSDLVSAAKANNYAVFKKLYEVLHDNEEGEEFQLSDRLAEAGMKAPLLITVRVFKQMKPTGCEIAYALMTADLHTLALRVMETSDRQFINVVVLVDVHLENPDNSTNWDPVFLTGYGEDRNSILYVHVRSNWDSVRVVNYVQKAIRGVDVLQKVMLNN